MTKEQAAAYVHAMSVAATAEIEAMKAENAERESNGYAQAYDGPAFMDVIDRYGIHHNAILTVFENSA